MTFAGLLGSIGRQIGEPLFVLFSDNKRAYSVTNTVEKLLKNFAAVARARARARKSARAQYRLTARQRAA